jgi:hypothetical protein
LFLGFANEPDYGCSAHSILPRRIGQAHTCQAVANESRVVDGEGLPPEFETFELPTTHSRLYPLLDKVGFQLSDAPNQRQEQASHRACGVDIFPPGHELDI